MFYLIYLFSSLILICNYANSNENPQKVIWRCGDKNCDTPLSEFKTTTNYLAPDHSAKLKFVSGATGKLYKKTLDDSAYEYWFVEIDGKKGYVHRSLVREGKQLSKNQVNVEEDDPLSEAASNATKDIDPSQPLIVDGTTIYNYNDGDIATSVPPNSHATPALNSNYKSTNVQDNTESTHSDSVDTSDKLQSNNLDNNLKNNLIPPGTGSYSAIDNYDDDDDGMVENDDEEEEEEEEVVEEVPSQSSTNYVNRDQSDSSSNDSSQGPEVNNEQSEQSSAAQQSDYVEKTESVSDTSNSSQTHTSAETGSSQRPPVQRDSLASSNSDSSGNSESHQPSTQSEFPVNDSHNATEKNMDYDHNLSTTESSVNSKEAATHNIDSNQEIFNSATTGSPVDYNYEVTKPGIEIKESSDSQALNDNSTQNTPDHSADYSQNTTESTAESNQEEPSENKDHTATDSSVGTDEVTTESLTNNDPQIVEENQENVLNDNEGTSSHMDDKQVVQSDVNDKQLDQLQVKPSAEETPSFEEMTTTDNSEKNLSGVLQDGPRLNSSPNDGPDSISNLSKDIEAATSDVQNVVAPVNTDNLQSNQVVDNNIPQEIYQNNQEHDDTHYDTELNNSPVDNDESSNYYSPILSFFSSLKELFGKSDLTADQSAPSLTGDNEEQRITDSPEADYGYCHETGTCGGLERPIGGEDQPSSVWDSHRNLDISSRSTVPMSFNSVVYICVTAVVLLLFSLGYYYIDKSQNSSYLVEKTNELSRELFVTKKERDTLEDQLLKVKENCNMMDSSKMKQDSKMTTLQNSLEESETARTQLEETVLRLEKEVETLMDQGMEMHKLLSETISDEERSQMLLGNIDELKESLSEKLDEIVTLTTQLDKKNEEIQLMQIDIRNSNDRVTDLERKLESCRAVTEEKFTKKLQDHKQQIIKLQQVLEEKGVNVAKLESELARTKVERDSAEARASSAEAGLQAAHSVGAGDARQAWLDATSVRAALVTANESNKTLQLDIADLTSNNKIFQEKINSLGEEISALNFKYENVEKEKVNALTKLQVLSDYFKEKETKLQEELGMKESLWLQKESEDHTIYEQMKSLREEIASYRAQNEKLKAEILEQEASYKVQIANEEQKSYDNWVALRQSERKVKELQMESAHFRNRLTQLESASNQSITEALNPNGLDKGSFSAPSPPFMMLPPPPHAEFYPLPPPPIHPSASRPPPLGRISSPQLSGEMMLPPPPLVPFGMLPSSSTPPPSLPMYKPQPRERPPPKDSPPSNYSSESMNEKAARRRRR